MKKSTILSILLGCTVAFSSTAKEPRNLSTDEYGLLREASVAMSCYDMRKASDVDVQVPLFKLYAERPDIGKALMGKERLYVLSRMNDVQFADFSSIPSRVLDDPSYYCSKYQK